MKNRHNFKLLKKYILIIYLFQFIQSFALNVESAMIYNFGHKIVKESGQKKRIKKRNIFKKHYADISNPNPNKLNIPESKSSVVLKHPLVLKPAQRKVLPVKVKPQFGSVTSPQQINSEYLYEGVLNSNLSFTKGSTTIGVSQNSINISRPLDDKHN
ncbi:MAG: hypothetical protein K0R49_1355 [Burkholderiales bacterium]|jgi:hypothetical protein|nr:hypothetical protein [Burkholderiales bacterium]MCE3269103.1 hypothetical protein [Burkholderiales bacterium]